MLEAIRQVLPAKTTTQREVTYLEQIQDALFASTETVEGTGNLPLHLIAHGRIDPEGLKVRTAISINLDPQQKCDDVEFATNVGQIPNTPLSDIIVDGLNHRLNGKFVICPSEQTGSLDLVYTSRQPADWLDQVKIRRELENHAMAQEIVTPILTNASLYALPDPQSSHPETRGAIQRIIDGLISIL